MELDTRGKFSALIVFVVDCHTREMAVLRPVGAVPLVPLCSIFDII